MRRWLLPAGLALVVLAADQLSKAWAITQLGPEPYERFLSPGPAWFNLIYAQNTGVAFGLFQNMPVLFTFSSILITVGAVYTYVRHLPNQSLTVQLAMGLLLGGALGNISDRLRYGYVVDLISLGWWPVFNLADSAITIGVFLLAGYLILIGDEPMVTPLPPPRDDGLLNDLLSHDVE